jgi:Fur family peroxide stress response transcriptional regulator
MTDVQDRLDELMANLREQGYRLTPQRRAVLRILASCKQHPSAEQIFEQVSADFPGTSLATIYKTLALLKEQGEICELSFGDGCNRYDCRTPYPHPHLVCVNCRRISDLDFDDLQQTADRVAQHTGYEIVSHRFDFFGVCPECQDAHEAPE